MGDPAEILEAALIERYQRDFPLVRKPFAAIARELGAPEHLVIATVERLLASGRMSRLGAVIRPNVAGISTLAAMTVPKNRLDDVADLVSRDPGVNHNYERENALNLWFVLHAANEDDLVSRLSRIASATGLDVHDLRLAKEYRIDLGFSLTGETSNDISTVGALPVCDPDDVALIGALDDGLEASSAPFDPIAEKLGLDVDDCLARIAALRANGAIRRFGLVVNHRAYGYAANAMVVWNLPDEIADGAGEVLAKQQGVTLCYRRWRSMPVWPFNLYAMIHGKSRRQVESRIVEISAACGLDAFPRTVLFSSRCFKQTGARRKAAAA